MKASLTPEETYSVQVGDHTIEGFRVMSRWNGLIELRNARNEILIVSAPDIRPTSDRFHSIFGDIFRTAAEIKDAGTVILMATPDLMARLRDADAPPAPTDPGFAPPPPPSAPPTRRGP